MSGKISQDLTVPYKPGIFIPGVDMSLAVGNRNIKLLASSITQSQFITPQQFGAIGNGVVDDTLALQAAINAGIANQTPVYIPGGRYLISSALTINRGVHIFGAYAEPQTQMFTSSPNTTGNGTWIVLDGTHLVSVFTINPTGTPSNANQAMGVEIDHFGIYHTQPAPGAGWAPAGYPPAINIPAGSDVNLHDICLFNPTHGIWANGQSAGRLVIERITGQPLSTGILLDNQTDTVLVRDVHFWVNWSLDPTVLTYMKAHVTGLVLYRIDNPVIDNFVCLWMWVGASISESPDGHGGPGNVRLTNCDFDECVNPVVITGPSNNITVFMSGCILAGPAEDPAVNQAALTIESGVVGAQIFLSTCSLWYNGSSAVDIAPGTNSHVRMAACQIYEWDRQNAGYYALQSSAGSSIFADAATLTFSTNSNTRVRGTGGECVKQPPLQALVGTMGAGATSVVIPHTLGAVPNVILVTPNGNGTPATEWLGVADASNVNVAVNVAPTASCPFSVLIGFA